jgi:dihydroflavonol-4-reductase
VKILVTGGSGFLGQHLSHRLVEEGHQVTWLVRSQDYPAHDLPSWQGQIKHSLGDICWAVEKLIPLFRGYDRVYHLAGLIGYKRSQAPAIWEVNVQGTIHVTQACMAAEVPELVYTSSVAAIGASVSPTVILNEESPFNLSGDDFSYFVSKHQAEIELTRLTQNHPIKTYFLNPSTIYGAHDFTKGSRGTQKKVALGRFPFHTSGGVNVVSVHDVVEALIQVPVRGQKNRRYIISSENITIRELFDMIRSIAGVSRHSLLLPKPILYALGWIGDQWEQVTGRSVGLSLANAKVATLYHWFDNTRARTELGLTFRPAQSAIEESVKSLLASLSRRTS